MRGSTPCAREANKRYGGNTACVAVEVPGREPIILDLGHRPALLRPDPTRRRPFDGVALVSHLHWDHVQGLPFFTPGLCPGASLDVYGPKQTEGSLEAAVREFMRPPYFPVALDDLPGEIRSTTAPTRPFIIDDVEVRAADVPHIGPTNGYRIELDGVTVAYISDHQQPGAARSRSPTTCSSCATASTC